jgi:hypothetical protein
MLMLPDYPDRVISEHRLRVERASLIATFTLIAAGAWWLLGSLQSDSGILIRFGPVALMFSAAFLVPELVEFGPSQRFRISTCCNVLWPPLLAITEVQRQLGSELLPLMILALVVITFWMLTRRVLSVSLRSRRWRGLTSIVGLGLAIPIVSYSNELLSWGIVAIPPLATIAPDLLAKDQLHGNRQSFQVRLRDSEKRLLEIQSNNPGMQQPASLIQIAREQGWEDPESGLRLLSEANREADRIIALREDLEAIRVDSEKSIENAERVTGASGKARTLYDLAVRESEQGSIRDAEELFRSAKSKANAIESFWLSASDAIEEAEGLIGGDSGHLVDGVREVLSAAKKAMEEEDPENALAIVSTIPRQMESVANLLESAYRSIEEAEHTLAALDESSSEGYSERLEEAKLALQAGDASLAKGLADGISRDQRNTSEATNSVQRALRHRKQIEDRFPVGEGRKDWEENLDQISSLASLGDWAGAADSLAQLTSELDIFESNRNDAQELLDFLQGEWIEVRKRLDSAGIGPDDPSRRSVEKSLALSEEAISEGNIQVCLDSLGTADTALESLRRRA